MPNVPAPDKMRAVPQSLDELDKYLQELHQSINDVERRLAPVLSPRENTDAEKINTGPAPVPTLVSSRLDDSRAHVGVMSAKLHSILERLHV